jgi:glycosyltransferase involved in cell wall biosynthesis
MRIIYDGQAFSFQEYGGISRYFFQLLKEFQYKENISAELIIGYSNNHYLESLEELRINRFSPNFRFKGRNEIIKRLNQSYFKKQIDIISSAFIFHPTYYNPYFLDISDADIPFVLTVHDMTHERFPGSFNKFDFTAKHKKMVALKAGRIITISEFTKRNIIEILGIPAEKIDVIYHGNSLYPDNNSIKKTVLPENYILFVGQRNTYKNFEFFIKALSLLIKHDRSLYIVCAGGRKFSRKEFKLFDKLGIQNNIFQMRVTDDLLAQLYSNAKVFVFPSLYEGFGIPVLEAFNCGCPALLSNRSSLPEIGGDAAIYFDPEDEQSLIYSLRKILENNDLRNELIKKGSERANLFSWQITAKKTLETYKKLL